VTSEDFTSPSATGQPASSETSFASPASGGDGGLSNGAKAGIAVGTIIGSFFLVGAIAFVVLRKRRAGRSNEFELGASTGKGGETASSRSH